MISCLEDLKKTYQAIKLLDKEERIKFLDSIVAYCDYIKFNQEKTMMILALIRNVIPVPNQKWTECEWYDEVDIEFNKKLLKKFAEQQAKEKTTNE